jgi:exosortase/archaeosortase family protein
LPSSDRALRPSAFRVSRFHRSQTALVLVVLPIAILKNGVRILTLSLLAIHLDPGYLTGQLHKEVGVVFFVLALAMMQPLLWLFLRLEWRQQLRLSLVKPSWRAAGDAVAGISRLRSRPIRGQAQLNTSRCLSLFTLDLIYRNRVTEYHD